MFFFSYFLFLWGVGKDPVGFCYYLLIVFRTILHFAFGLLHSAAEEVEKTRRLWDLSISWSNQGPYFFYYYYYHLDHVTLPPPLQTLFIFYRYSYCCSPLLLYISRPCPFPFLGPRLICVFFVPHLSPYRRPLPYTSSSSWFKCRNAKETRQDEEALPEDRPIQQGPVAPEFRRQGLCGWEEHGHRRGCHCRGWVKNCYFICMCDYVRMCYCLCVCVCGFCVCFCLCFVF